MTCDPVSFLFDPSQFSRRSAIKVRLQWNEQNHWTLNFTPASAATSILLASRSLMVSSREWRTAKWNALYFSYLIEFDC